MDGWGTRSGERAAWVLEPLVRVGPLWFGMRPGEVASALGGAIARASRGLGSGIGWGSHPDWGATAIYGADNGLVAVAVDATDGPLVRLRDVELIGRVPSEVRTDLRGLALREGTSVRVNRGGDPEVEAWGISLGAVPAHGLTPEGYLRRLDTVLTHALLVGPELAADPFGSEPVVRWRDVRAEPPDAGAWPVRADRERQHWDWTPLVNVGPLAFGMRPREVAGALGEEPTARHGRYPFGTSGEGPGPWLLGEDRFDRVGVTAHYSGGRRRSPTLDAVTVHGRTGPQVELAGIRLVGRPVSAVDAALVQHVEGQGLRLVVGPDGELAVAELGMRIRAARAGDAVVSEARFGAAGGADHG
ncbi:hypothetical protein RM844_05840 [Streptomyces sp. DSM 44915]|uniref:Uncharacterized protein n=1 Tax=Streptomyces chisholmiae TaxID=3075540 RepID=A0ABU2JM61_9ACTN|nr:hypothetical protein [Streptomyces sp. DSM 44915]MDT0265809.1 hypothetical protein [Streptomyces sp. DSM 44915]